MDIREIFHFPMTFFPSANPQTRNVCGFLLWGRMCWLNSLYIFIFLHHEDLSVVYYRTSWIPFMLFLIPTCVPFINISFGRAHWIYNICQRKEKRAASGGKNKRASLSLSTNRNSSVLLLTVFNPAWLMGALWLKFINLGLGMYGTKLLFPQRPPSQTPVLEPTGGSSLLTTHHAICCMCRLYLCINKTLVIIYLTCGRKWGSMKGAVTKVKNKCWLWWFLWPCSVSLAVFSGSFHLFRGWTA